MTQLKTISQPKNKIIILFTVCVLLAGGCGTTKWSDTNRTGTEQLLISNAIDNAVGKIDFTPIGNKYVFLNTDAINDTTDYKYLAMALRQQMAANGAVICDKEEESDYIVEIRVGAIGTDRDDMLIGIPALTFPSIPGTNFTASTIPEIPFIKRTKQRGVAKIALFAYNKHTGRPLWASGNKQSESQARNLWFAGTGPLTRGTIYDETTFAGHTVSVPEFLENKKDRYLKSFADRDMIFNELPNEPFLNDRIEKKISQTNITNIEKTTPSIQEIPRYSADTPETSSANALPIYPMPPFTSTNQ
ncbi:MAG: hypothetical protein LBC20_15595 [Planctomycetaceae bacterium]|jgi:hypothetical protein|nr:hypothetical protein [Planctomycetaceae bacterium]